MNLLSILDWSASIITVSTLLLVSKYPKAWIAYSVGAFLFTIVCSEKGLVGLTCMGMLLVIIGLRNYSITRR